MSHIFNLNFRLDVFDLVKGSKTSNIVLLLNFNDCIIYHNHCTFKTSRLQELMTLSSSVDKNI